jgi:hypothetical protein
VNLEMGLLEEVLCLSHFCMSACILVYNTLLCFFVVWFRPLAAYLALCLVFICQCLRYPKLASPMVLVVVLKT